MATMLRHTPSLRTAFSNAALLPAASTCGLRTAGKAQSPSLQPRRIAGCGAASLRIRPRGDSVVVASGQSLEASFTGAGGGRAGAAQLREELLEAGQAPLDAAATPNASGEVLRETAEYLAGELRRIFSTGAVTRQRYAEDITFQDPVARLKGREAYVANIQLLNSLFDVEFKTHSIRKQEPDSIHTKWTMVLVPKFLPWRPSLVLTGSSEYTVNTATGQITDHRHTWDALADNSYFSLEGLALVLRSLTTVQLTPSLETPRYTVLRRTGDYEIRRYEPYMVAEVDMPAGSGPAGGDGFNDLAGYIFGGNNRHSSMEMTTPVYSNAGQGSSEGSGRMQFVMEERYGRDAAALPAPNNANVERRLEEAKVVAALQFPGIPLDWEVRAAERRLRGALLLDRLEAGSGYHLARYNDPFTLPPLRRNEVLIRLPEGFEP